MGKEKEEKIKIIENNRDQLLENLKQERTEKNELRDKKIRLERENEDSKLEISQLEDKLKVVQVDIGNCIVEKQEENNKSKKLEATIVKLKDEKVKMESHCMEISKNLDQLKINMSEKLNSDKDKETNNEN